MSRRGRVFQRVKGRGEPWSYTVDVGPEGGPRKQQKKGGYRTQREAQDALTAVLASLGTGTFIEPSKATVGEYLTAWLDALEARSRKPSTPEAYRRVIANHLLGCKVGDTPDRATWRPVALTQMQKLSAVQLDALYADLLANGRRDGTGGLSLRTVRFIHSVLHRALGDAVRKKLIAVNPTDAADPPSTSDAKAPETAVWTPAQVTAFLTSVADDEWYPLWRLLITTGCRRGEAIGLRWSDIDWEHKRLSISQQVTPVRGRPTILAVKTDGSARSVDVGDGTLEALRRQRARQAETRLAIGPGYQAEHDLVFADLHGAPIHPKQVNRWFAQRVARAGLPAIRLHDLRHTAASIMLASGEAVKVVQERLGHATPGFTMQRYQKLLPGMGAETAKRYEDLVDGGAR